MDRIDLRLEVPPVGFQDLDRPADGEDSATVAARVSAARGTQTTRFSSHPNLRTNADLSGTVLEEVATPDAEGRELLLKAADRFNITARGYHRVLRLARTIADLENSQNIRAPHIGEALSYRIIRDAV
jgi:magnesium chelatase family protein